MSEVPKTYVSTVSRVFRSHATWPPGTLVEIGDIGVLKAGAFVRQSSLREKKVPFRRITRDGSSMRFASASGVTFTGSGKGRTERAVSAIGKASAGIKIGFSRQGALAMVLEGVTAESIADIDQVVEWMVNKSGRRMLKDDQIVITHVSRAKSGVIAMSQEAGATVQLKTDIDVTTGPIALAKVGGKLELVTASNTEFVVIPRGTNGITPLFHYLTYKQWWELGPEVQQKLIRRTSRN